ncbi:MAG: class I SAM-dependent methyltransferase [Ectothiorhodospiraceae bacterium]|nr:class I SAM-dependent methyltransferase [Chromatiales bacterium]MCP5153513.1 class I SAM-dependent methyltransferase [Ectothiorhodospiraceae bacterium]
MAERADRHHLYQEAVQCVEAEIDFVDETFTTLRGRKASRLREDFCGTANTSCEWVRRRASNQAVGIDLDPDVQAWGREHNVAKLGRAAGRVELVTADVMKVRIDPVDIAVAHNFSYWIFKERAQMRRYFRRVRDALVDDGIFFLDAYGGSDAYREMRERTELDDFTYIWDQATFNPINGDMSCHIHFSFPDGSRLRNAFSYHWRLWTLPEIREILAEAGFRRNTVYWQGTDEDSGEGNGEFEPSEVGEADPAWIVYIVAEK